MQSTIKWNEVRKRAIDLGLRTDRAIARAAGLHPNTIGKNDSYRSSTVDALAILFKCEPQELIDWVEVAEDE